MPEYSDREWESYSQSTGVSRDRDKSSHAPAPNHLVPIPLIRPKDQAEPYPKQALGPLTAAVDAVAQLTSAPYALAAQSIIAAASLATQNFAVVETLQSTKPVSVFMLSVAESGERKSACDALSLQGVRRFERKRQEQYGGDFAAYTNELDLFAAQRRTILAKSQAKDAARADLEALGAEPKPPTAPELLLTDPTIEGLFKHYEASQPSLGLFSDEGGQFLGGYGMSSDNRLKTAAAMSKLWDGGSVNRTRSSTGPSMTFHDKRLTCHLMIQPRIAETLLADETLRDQGLLSRMLIAWPISHIGQRTISIVRDETVNGDAENHLSAFHSRIEELLEKGLPKVRLQTNTVTLGLTDETRDVIIQYYNSVETNQAEGHAFQCIRGFASKAAEQTLRLAGILQIYKDDTVGVLATEHLVCAVKLMDWYLAETKRLLEGTSVTESLKQAETLRRWLIGKWNEPYIDIRSIVRLGPNCVRDATTARNTVHLLERNHWLIKQDGPLLIKGANSNTSWRINRPNAVAQV